MILRPSSTSAAWSRSLAMQARSGRRDGRPGLIALALGVTLLDVRPEDEFALGHLPGSLNVPLDELERRLADLPMNQDIIAYCRGPYCVLSFQAVAQLRKRGYRVRRLVDGFPEWKAAGLRVESHTYAPYPAKLVQ